MQMEWFITRMVAIPLLLIPFDLPATEEGTPLYHQDDNLGDSYSSD